MRMTVEQRIINDNRLRVLEQVPKLANAFLDALDSNLIYPIHTCQASLDCILNDLKTIDETADNNNITIVMKERRDQWLDHIAGVSMKLSEAVGLKQKSRAFSLTFGLKTSLHLLQNYS